MTLKQANLDAIQTALLIWRNNSRSKQDWVPLSSHFPDDLQKLLMKTSEEEQ